MKRKKLCQLLNKAFKAKKSCVRFEPFDVANARYYISIVADDPFMSKDGSIPLTDDFFEVLQSELQKLNVPPASFNNTGHTFWIVKENEHLLTD